MKLECSQSGPHIPEYDCLRVIATLLVVLGHCPYYSLITEWGGVNYSSLVAELSFLYKVFNLIVRFVYFFHMPMFMALSGALFRIAWNIKKYRTYGNLVMEKGKRLLIPFFVISIFYAFPLKLISGYYSNSENIVLDLVVGQIMLQGNNHLWYCLALFAIFIVIYFLESTIPSPKWLNIIFLMFAYYFGSEIKISIISKVCQYALWFYLGFCFEPLRKRINTDIERNRYLPIICFTAAILLLGSYYCMKDNNITLLSRCIIKAINFFLIVALCACTYIVAYALSKTAVMKNKLFKVLLRDSFGIYLYSDPWNYVFLFACTALLGSFVFESNIGSLFFLAIRFFGTLGISVVITEFFRKIGFKNLY